jgi:hypothetical protein
VKEQSHKDEMSAAIRGDFQRLRDRGVAATLAPDDPAEHPEAGVAPEVEPEVEPRVEPEPGPAPELVAVDATPAATAPAPPAGAGEPGDREQPGFFARLLGR